MSRYDPLSLNNRIVDLETELKLILEKVESFEERIEEFEERLSELDEKVNSLI
jgi:predicted  nucleic acid-binding Zn-ribbon protein